VAGRLFRAEVTVDPALRDAALSHYEELARLGKAMSSPVRLRVLDLLRQGPRSVEVLAVAAGVSVANASQHLQQLRAARVVVSEKQGQQVVYRLAHDGVGALFVALRSLGESVLPEMDRLKETLQVHDGTRRAALLQSVSGGEVTLLDVRPTEEWRGGHLLDAVHIPLGELAARVGELPRKKPVVAYCRGPYCPMALTAVEILRAAGYAAEHLDLGPPDLARGTALARRLVVAPALRTPERTKAQATPAKKSSSTPASLSRAATRARKRTRP
jgi:rhodanese-related sulfurtransferase/DNA-binding transcriptional ArsR family regulator